MNIYDTLTALGITLPAVSTPAAAYVPFVQTGKLVFISGNIARKDGTPWVGQLGKTMATEEGKLAARSCAVQLMAALHAACVANGGDLNSVKRIVKVMSLVNSSPDFTEHHLVTNGCSELLGQVFGPQIGAHARSAFGVAQIPMGACVEIEMIVELA
jgi:enamine deaminase RidA (YjgF/YER057c/UK114 family)